MKRNGFVKLLFILICIISTIFISVGVYASTSYLPVDIDSYISSGDKVEVNDNGSYIEFKAQNSTKGIIFYPGGLVDPLSYSPLLYKLAEDGVTCFLFRMPYNLAFFNMNAAKKVIEANSSLDLYGAGHSLGGVAIASSNLSEYKGIILLASYSPSEIAVPTLLIRGSEDGVLNISAYEKAKSNYLSFDEMIIDGGNHAGFASYGKQKKDHDALIDNLVQIEMTKEYILEFMN